MSEKKRVISGDRPTGSLHLGHYVGSIKNRVLLQKEHQCFFMVADLHVLTTRQKKEELLLIRDHCHEMVLDYLACGIDPKESTIYLQSTISEVFELQLYCGILVSFNRLTNLPTIKEMARNAHIDENNLPFGLLGYPVLQAADILLSRAHIVPVGRDNEAHVEITRDIARRFNQYYGELFPLPEALLSDTPALVGLDGEKMSKSRGNAIFFSDDRKSVEKKVRSMFTDPNRIRADVPGTVENNPVFIYHDLFNLDKEEVAELKERYRKGSVGDVEVKEKLQRALIAYLEPFWARRERFSSQKGFVEHILEEGTSRMRLFAKETLEQVRSHMGFAQHWKKIQKLAKEYRSHATL